MSLDLLCNGCGRDIEVIVLVNSVRVVPCEKCMSDERETGWDDGNEDGQESRDDEVASLQEEIKHLNIAIQSLQEQLDTP